MIQQRHIAANVVASQVVSLNHHHCDASAMQVLPLMGVAPSTVSTSLRLFSTVSTSSTSAFARLQAVALLPHPRQRLLLLLLLLLHFLQHLYYFFYHTCTTCSTTLILLVSTPRLLLILTHFYYLFRHRSTTDPSSSFSVMQHLLPLLLQARPRLQLCDALQLLQVQNIAVAPFRSLLEPRLTCTLG